MSFVKIPFRRVSQAVARSVVKQPENTKTVLFRNGYGYVESSPDEATITLML